MQKRMHHSGSGSEIQIRKRVLSISNDGRLLKYEMTQTINKSSNIIYKAGLVVNKHDQLTHRISRDYRFQQQTRHDLCGIWAFLFEIYRSELISVAKHVHQTYMSIQSPF